jgi:hypothetical protein
VDDSPDSQFLYPEFLLAKQMLEQAGLTVHIVDPADLSAQEDGLYFAGERIDLIYNRLTDFDLKHYPALREAWTHNKVLLTPNPAHYQRYADKRKLTLLTDEAWLRAHHVTEETINVLLQGIPQTRIPRVEETEHWWGERKQWFFKPVNGYGSKGAYRGDKLTKRVFQEIMQSDYVAQKLAAPGEIAVPRENGEAGLLKFDLRCYVYAGQIQLIAARLYQDKRPISHARRRFWRGYIPRCSDLAWPFWSESGCAGLRSETKTNYHQ